MDNETNFSNSSSNSSSNSTFEGWQAQQEPKRFWTNLTLPILYIVVMVGSLYTFSSLYRKRQVTKTAKLEPWFAQHKSRDIYLSLLHLDPSEASGSSSGKNPDTVPDSMLKAALLSRATEDIRRIVQLRTSKPALQALFQRGSVGEEIWQRLLRAEKEIEEEVKDVVNEANAFSPGWGQTIFQSANEIHQNNLLKERTADIQAQLETEKAWWENRRTTIQSQFMKELDAEAAEKPAEAATPQQRKTGSDDDAVLVEAGGPAQQAQGSLKKRNNKK